MPVRTEPAVRPRPRLAASPAARELAAAGITEPALVAAYLRCRRLNARHGRTYYLATLLLPPGTRPFVHALYGFARYADDIVDEYEQSEPVAVRADRFERWSADTLVDLDWGATSDPVVRALVDTVRRWAIPTSYVADFLESMRMDLTTTRYDTDADLARYTWGSAAVIGLQMLPLLGRADPTTGWDVLEPYAIDLGVAFQLTNFLRDVGEDLRRGRIYLPLEDLRRFGVDETRLARGRVDEPIRNLLADRIERTRQLYLRAEPGIELVAPSSRDCLRTAFELYRGILGEIEAADYDVFSGRVSVSLRRRAAVAGPGLWRAAEARGAAPTRVAGAVRRRLARPRPTR